MEHKLITVADTLKNKRQAYIHDLNNASMMEKSLNLQTETAKQYFNWLITSLKKDIHSINTAINTVEKFNIREKKMELHDAEVFRHLIQALQKAPEIKYQKLGRNIISFQF